MNWYLQVLKKYAVFNGRARRSEYWFFYLFSMIFAIVAIILDNLLGIAIEDLGYGPIYALYILAIIVPGFAVAVRRMHDVGKSGWYVFIPLYNLILALTEGDKEINKYGEDPKIIDTQGYDDSYSIIMSLVMAAFIACASYSLLSETKIIDGFQKSEIIKNVVFGVFFVISFIYYVTNILRNKNRKKVNLTNP